MCSSKSCVASTHIQLEFDGLIFFGYFADTATSNIITVAWFSDPSMISGLFVAMSYLKQDFNHWRSISMNAKNGLIAWTHVEVFVYVRAY